MIGISIIGAGRFAQHHLAALAAIPGTELIGVMDPDQGRATSTKTRFAAKHADTDLAQALERPGIDAIVVAAPTGIHAMVTLAALENGYHVLVEKPISVNLAEAMEMHEAATAANRIVMGAHVCRFMPMFQKAFELIQRGDLGPPVQFVERNLVYRTEVYEWWKTLRHFLIGHWGSHSVDLLFWWLDQTASLAYCSGQSHMPGYEGIDDFTLHLQLADGSRASFHQTFNSRFEVHDMVLVGEDATLSFDCYTTLSVDGQEVLTLPQEEMLRTAFRQQMAAFIMSVAGETLPHPDVKSLLPLMATLDAAVDSLETGRVVDLDRET